MESISNTFYESLKRSWRRRKYQRLSGSNNKKRKLKIIRLGGATRRLWKLRITPKLKWKVGSPIRLLVNFHDAYVDMMIWVANNMGNLNSKGLFGGKKIAKEKQISMVSYGEEVVDTKLVFEIYKRLAASGTELRGFSN